MIKTYKGLITTLSHYQVFVFGANPSGIHGAGTAKIAVIKYGAEYGKGRGIQGQSYGLITKNLTAGYYEHVTGITYKEEGFRSVSESQIRSNVYEFYRFAEDNPDKEFLVAYTTGPNLNGYSPEEMAKIFASLPIPENMVFNDEFAKLVEENEMEQN